MDLTTIGAFVAGIFVAVLPLAKLYQQAWMERKGQDIAEKKDVATGWQAIAKRLTNQVKRLERQIDEMQHTINFLSKQIMGSQVLATELYGILERVYDVNRRNSERLVELKEVPEEAPPMPPRPQRYEMEADFARRTTAQNAETAKGIDGQIQKTMDEKS